MKTNQTTYNRADRNEKEPYALIAQKLLNDDRLSVIEVGIMVRILKNSDDFVLNITYQQKQSGIGRIQFDNAIKHLIELGYLHKEKVGLSYSWTVNEVVDSRLSDSRLSDFRQSENEQLISNNRTNNKLINNNRKSNNIISNKEKNSSNELDDSFYSNKNKTNPTVEDSLESDKNIKNTSPTSNVGGTPTDATSVIERIKNRVAQRTLY